MGSVRPNVNTTGLSQEYQDLLSKNPYRREAVGGFLGIGKKQKQQELDILAAEYDANIYKQAHSEEYDSPEEQVARMRAAGINPDLAGGVQPGAAFDPFLSPSGYEERNPVDDIGTFAEVGLNVASLLAGFQAQGFAQGMDILEAAHSMAKQYPDEYVNIAPKGSGLAPILVRSKFTADKLAEAVPGLSRQQRRKLAEGITSARESMGTKLSSVQTRSEIASLLNNPDFAFPEESKEILRLTLRCDEIDAKHKLQAKIRISEISGKLAEEDASLELKKRETASMQEQAMQDSAAAVSAEAQLRKTSAENTDPVEVGKARTSAATTQQVQDILRQEEAAAAREQLEEIEKAEKNGLFNGSMMSDVLKFKVGRHNKERWQETKKHIQERKRVKRQEKRKYGKSSSNSSISVDTPIGKVNYSD